MIHNSDLNTQDKCSFSIRTSNKFLWEIKNKFNNKGANRLSTDQILMQISTVIFVILKDKTKIPTFMYLFSGL